MGGSGRVRWPSMMATMHAGQATSTSLSSAHAGVPPAVIGQVGCAAPHNQSAHQSAERPNINHPMQEKYYANTNQQRPTPPHAVLRRSLETPARPRGSIVLEKHLNIIHHAICYHSFSIAPPPWKYCIRTRRMRNEATKINCNPHLCWYDKNGLYELFLWGDSFRYDNFLLENVTVVKASQGTRDEWRTAAISNSKRLKLHQITETSNKT